ncbi:MULTISPECIES: glutathione transferase GstA [Serratia]|uniref:glutathione transferase GstA n=1 Tax=Serratia TaxID=613 RepID=UPI000967FCFB|nr:MULTISPECIES: glutathione transferase GstA [Serratia]AYO37177.1 glutathione transferase GstA [Serratia sp. P2ACOL2]MBV0841152.1 glutathione transferase GstA [Serratia liquefaciens]OKP25371.1 glutathione transferase GstA [Serratia liquefaciens]RYM72280.1 glutathione transferase GstA [Serratia liquefaciens]RYM81238.1 glutathione transferase GstA [Serratia liquefaciens]
MKLYFAPDTCSLSPHIVLRELDLPFELIRVNNRTKRSADGGDFYRVNPKGYVAALMLDDGQVITEGTAIVQYLADLRPEAGLAPPNSTFERVRLQEWLNFITCEIHAGSSPLFNSTLPEEVKTLFRDKLRRRLDFVAQTLDEPAFLLGETFSVADAYLFTVLRWMDQFSIDLKYWPSITRYMSLISQRRSVQTALAAEAASQAVP